MIQRKKPLQNTNQQTTMKPKFFDSAEYQPLWEDNGQDDLGPEFAAVTGYDDSRDYGSTENDRILKLCMEFGV